MCYENIGNQFLRKELDVSLLNLSWLPKSDDFRTFWIEIEEGVTFPVFT